MLETSARPASAPPVFTREQFLLAGLLVVAAGLRLAVARSELWLDELWSLSFARELTKPWQILTAIHHDNNHPLNTLSLAITVKLVGAHAYSIVYRVLPLLTGIAMVPLLFWTEFGSSEEGSRARAWFAALLGAISFPAIVYSSEGRGYAPAALFALAAFAMVRRAGVEQRPTQRLAFAAFCVLGFLSHLTFLFPYAGIAAWTLARDLRRGRFAWREWIALHRLPIVFIAVYYVIDARKLIYGGGPPFRTPEVLSRALSLAVGGPDTGLVRNAAALCALCVIVWGIWDLVRRKNQEATFFGAALFIAPAGVLLFYKARFLDARYFFVLSPFLWLLAARALARLREHGAAGRTAAVVLVGISLTGSFLHLAPVLRDGRGHYTAAVATISALSSGEQITVGSDEDFPNRVVLEYYAEALPSGKKVLFVRSAAWTVEGPEWLLTYSFGLSRTGDPPRTQIAGANGKPYRWVRSFPYGGISGWNWHLYRRREGLEREGT